MLQPWRQLPALLLAPLHTTRLLHSVLSKPTPIFCSHGMYVISPGLALTSQNLSKHHVICEPNVRNEIEMFALLHGHGFGQVPGLVHITAAPYGHMVGQ